MNVLTWNIKKYIYIYIYAHVYWENIPNCRISDRINKKWM